MLRFRAIVLGALASMVIGGYALSGACVDANPNRSPLPEIPNIGEPLVTDASRSASSKAFVNSSTLAVNQAFSAVQRIMDGEQSIPDTSNPELVTQTDGQSTSQMLGQMMMSLGLVIALVLGLAWGANKLVMKNYTLGGGRIEVVTSLAISPKSKLHLVRVGDEQFLVAESSQTVNLISTVEANLKPNLSDLEGPAIEDANGRGQDVAPFSNHMAEWTRALENRAAPDVKSSLAMLQGLSQKLRGGGRRNG